MTSTEELRSATELQGIARAAAAAGAEVALALWRDRDRLDVRTKRDADDLVSDADLRTQRAVFDVLERHRPHDLLIGEEQQQHPASSGGAVEWWVDPIDGTTSYLYGRSDWSVSVAAVDPGDREVVAAAVIEPVLGVTTTAARGAGSWCDGRRLRVRERVELARALVDVNLGTTGQRSRAGLMVGALAERVRDVRRGGSAATTLALVATGRSDAAWVPGLRAWDGAAGLLIAAEAGAVVGDLAGPTDAAWPASGDVLAAPAGLWGPLRDLLADVYRA